MTLLDPRSVTPLLMPLLFTVACSDPAPGGSTDADPPDDPGMTSFPDLPGPVPTTGAAIDPTTTADATTTTATTATDDDTTAGPASMCGDGIQDPGEQCDDGDANSDNAFCDTHCNLNTCGDGHVFVGWELCDEGLANSDSYGSTCSTQCTPAARCGDHVLQLEFGEQCDLGLDNGTNNGDAQGLRCDPSCRIKGLRAFVTSQVFDGALGGIAGADDRCRLAADAAGLPQPYRFHAYLSTPDSPANARFPGPLAEALPYILITGKKLADSHAALLAQGPLGEGLSVTELGTSILNEFVATNTAPSGKNFNTKDPCVGWTSADPLVETRVGLTYPNDPGDVQPWLIDGWWTSMLAKACNKTQFHLYCLEI